MAHRVAVIGGDGIGPEVVAEALKVVRAAGVELDTTDFDLGGARYLRDGTVLPDDVLDELRGYDAILLNTAIAQAQDPVRMARAMRQGVAAGRDAYLAGRIPKAYHAQASSPMDGRIGRY